MNNSRILIKVLLITICISKLVNGLELDALDPDLNPELELEFELEKGQHPSVHVPATTEQSFESFDSSEYLRGNNKNNQDGKVVEYVLDGDDTDTGLDVTKYTFWDNLNHFLGFMKQYYFTFMERMVRLPNTLTTKRRTGISFTRTVSFKKDDVNIAVNYDENHCKSSDKYGGNECHYDWGETMNPQINVEFKKEGDSFQKGDVVKGSLWVDYIVPWHIECAVCGQDCVLKVPIVFYAVNIPMPPCPLGKKEIPSTLAIPVGDSSPFKGLPLNVKGDFSLTPAYKMLCHY